MKIIDIYIRQSFVEPTVVEQRLHFKLKTTSVEDVEKVKMLNFSNSQLIHLENEFVISEVNDTYYSVNTEKSDVLKKEIIENCKKYEETQLVIKYDDNSESIYNYNLLTKEMSLVSGIDYKEIKKAKIQKAIENISKLF